MSLQEDMARIDDTAPRGTCDGLWSPCGHIPKCQCMPIPLGDAIATFGVWRPGATRLVLSERGAVRFAEVCPVSEQAGYDSTEGSSHNPRTSPNNKPDKLILDVVPSESADADILAVWPAMQSEFAAPEGRDASADGTRARGSGG